MSYEHLKTTVELTAFELQALDMSIQTAIDRGIDQVRGWDDSVVDLRKLDDKICLAYDEAMNKKKENHA